VSDHEETDLPPAAGITAFEERIGRGIDSILEFLTQRVEPKHKEIFDAISALTEQSRAAATVAIEARDSAIEAVRIATLALEQARSNGSQVALLHEDVLRLSKTVESTARVVLTIGADVSEIRSRMIAESDYTRGRLRELDATGTDSSPRNGGG